MTKPATGVWGFERAFARACASAAASAPAVVGLALAVSAVAFGHVVWAVAASTAAAAVLRRASRFVAAAAALPAAASVVLLVLDDEFLTDLLRGSPHVVHRWLVAAFAAIPLLVGLRGIPAVRTALALSLTAPFAVATGFAPGTKTLQKIGAELGVAVGAVALSRLAARRRIGAAVVVFAAAVVQSAVVLHVFRATSSWRMTVSATLTLPFAYAAGAFEADLADGAEADAGTRLVVFCQRRPWAISLLVVVALCALCAPWASPWDVFLDPVGGLALLSLAAAGVAFLSHVGRGGRHEGDAVAPWLAANVAALALAITIWRRGSDMEFATALAITLSIAVWPLLAAAVLPGSPPAGTTPVAAAVLPVAIVLIPPVWFADFRGGVYWWFPSALCVLVAPLAFHAAVRCRLPTARLVAAALLVGIAARLLLPVEQYPERNREELASNAWGLPAAWLSIGLLAAAARRARTMTAVPNDHPIVEDFGGA